MADAVSPLEYSGGMLLDETVGPNSPQGGIPDIPPLPAEGEPTQVVFPRGLPASGKSTWARAVLAQHPAGSVVRINNDDLARMLFGAPWGADGGIAAGLLARAREQVLLAALADERVRLVIVDNTNLQTRTVNALARAALRAGAQVHVEDFFLAVPPAECITRDAARDVPVGREVIERMARQARGLTAWVAPDDVAMKVAPYPNDDMSLPEAVLVDIDGTLALMESGRSPYDWARVGEDTPNRPVVEAVRMYLSAGVPVMVLSGRDGSCEEQTRTWLAEHVANDLPLFMRSAGDSRRDSIVKHELFQSHVAGRFRVKVVLDDRDQVVALWRALGLPCWQVAAGAF